MELTFAEFIAAHKRTQKQENHHIELASPPPPVLISGTLDPYAGPWTEAASKHLLFRTVFGPTQPDIEAVQEMGMEEAISQLLADPPEDPPPINYDFAQDPNTPIGETWIDKPLLEGQRGYRRRSLRAWFTGLLVEKGMTVHEKMTLFWHNHFVTAGTSLPRAEYQYLQLLRTHALGNFRTLTKEMTINHAMLRYLNGHDNSAQAPNENYARELFELFTVGKGNLVAPGDYSTFTEDDVLAASKVLTGWRAPNNAQEPGEPQPIFRPFRHDKSTKQLSHHYGNAVIENGDELEYARLIDIIFDSGKPARFLARNLYRWFVYYHIDEAIEQNVIEPLAQVILDNDYEIKPALQALLASAHFYDENSIGCQIKSPADFVATLVRQFSLFTPPDLLDKYRYWYLFYQGIALIQMELLNPPSVAGWQAFYQEPNYNRLWINSVTLPIRLSYSDVFSTIGLGMGGQRLQIDVFGLIAELPNPLNPNDMIRDLAKPVFPMGLSDGQVDFLKEVLIPGLPDEEWTIEYSAYLNDPGNPVIKAAVELKLRVMLRTMLSFAEYHLQ